LRVLAVAEDALVSLRDIVGSFPTRVAQERTEHAKMVQVQVLLPTSDVRLKQFRNAAVAN
jgi:hypothetical protein